MSMSGSSSRRLLSQLVYRSSRIQPVVPQTPRRLGVTIALLVAAGGCAWTVQAFPEYDISRHLRTRWIAQADAAALPNPTKGKGNAETRADPETSVSFPLYLKLSTPTPDLALVGLGVRKVSFLRVKVYSVGFYLEDRVLQHLDDIPGWQSFTAQHLLTPPTTNPSDPLGAPQLSGEALMRTLLEAGTACAVRIVPVRNTDFSHLRDSFTRALLARQKIARAKSEITEEDEARIAESLQTFKSLFPSQSLPKGESLVLIRTTDGSLHVESGGRLLGSVRDAWVAREMMLAYFADKDIISPVLKEDVAKGLEQYNRK
ncbi:chalcone-flavanone isomerase-domain-containing protein [Naematelia encephala]|uniref:Chalcone-flavanone isomerase-domain-containing protein n=1 Tax=Naematelia encephala TaxID=71784 RepID=A0A1Y2B358_9TREE|nr:chalcone-flavanone isomerase-domain-containing protein [Naematelia encephala]